MEEVECWRMVEEVQKNDAQTNVDDVNVEAPSPSKIRVVNEATSWEFVSAIQTFTTVEEPLYLPITGPNVAIGAEVRNTKDKIIGRYLFGTSSPIATLKESCTVSPRP